MNGNRKFQWKLVLVVLISAVVIYILISWLTELHYRTQFISEANLAKTVMLAYCNTEETRKALQWFDLYLYYLELAKTEPDKHALKVLRDALKEDTFLKDVVYLSIGFSETDSSEALQALDRASLSNDPNVRRLAKMYKAILLGRRGKEVLIAILNEYFDTPDNKLVKVVLGLAIKAVDLIGKELATEKALKYSRHELPVVRFVSLYVLATFLNYDEHQFYYEFFKDRAPAVRSIAMLIEYYLGPREFYPEYEVILDSQEEAIFKYLTLAILDKLASRGDRRAKGLLYRTLRTDTRGNTEKLRLKVFTIGLIANRD